MFNRRLNKDNLWTLLIGLIEIILGVGLLYVVLWLFPTLIGKYLIPLLPIFNEPPILESQPEYWFYGIIVESIITITGYFLWFIFHIMRDFINWLFPKKED